jgi:hypothetical protein
MADPKKPLAPAEPPDEVVPDFPDTDQPVRELPEGQLPGMPVWRDRLLNPGPTPSERETPPLD